MNKYDLILCDPPWSYTDKATAGKRGAEFKYDCMSERELFDMKPYIDEISNLNSVLFMWSTGPMLPVSIKVMESWGFKYKTVAFTWIKRTRNGKMFWGMGNTTRSNPEFVIYGVKGKGIKRISASVHSVIESQIREHSRKPDELREKLLELYGDISRIEMFSREQFEGWDQHGDQCDMF